MVERAALVPRSKGAEDSSRLESARRLVCAPSEALPGRRIEVVPGSLWYGIFGSQPVTVIFLRDEHTIGYDVALVTTDVSATPKAIIEGYAARWSSEVAIEDAKGNIGVGQARNRTPLAVERTAPFGFVVGTIAVPWYVTAGHHPDDVQQVRERSPWYCDKVQPSALDMPAKLRRVVIAAQFPRVHPLAVTSAEFDLLRLAWEDAAT